MFSPVLPLLSISSVVTIFNSHKLSPESPHSAAKHVKARTRRCPSSCTKRGCRSDGAVMELGHHQYLLPKVEAPLALTGVSHNLCLLHRGHAQQHGSAQEEGGRTGRRHQGTNVPVHRCIAYRISRLWLDVLHVCNWYPLGCRGQYS